MERKSLLDFSHFRILDGAEAGEFAAQPFFRTAGVIHVLVGQRHTIIQDIVLQQLVGGTVDGELDFLDTIFNLGLTVKGGIPVGDGRIAADHEPDFLDDIV